MFWKDHSHRRHRGLGFGEAGPDDFAPGGPGRGGPHHAFRFAFHPRAGRGLRGPFAHRPPSAFGPKGPPFGGPFGGRGPFGGGPFDDDGGRRRHRRGDLKYVLLELLAQQPRHGYELIKALEQRNAGFYRPSPGSVYPLLQLLEDEGSVTSEQVEGKRVYTITDAGRQLLEQHQQQRHHGHAPDSEGRHGPDAELETLQRSVMALMSSVKEVARHGTPEQRRAALERLDATRRELYRILAQDDSSEVV